MNEKKEKAKYGTISLSLPLINQIKEKINGTGIYSVSAYVTFVLRQIFSSQGSEEVLDKKTEEELKARLRSLGYI